MGPVRRGLGSGLATVISLCRCLGTFPQNGSLEKFVWWLRWALFSWLSRLVRTEMILSNSHQNIEKKSITTLYPTHGGYQNIKQNSTGKDIYNRLKLN
ncbi:hypothetical protein HZ326_0045 [Fusarium oxysporum f. sp. albedinis]|nr:hypothetical protein HZ326_0045 [Fusarium oxysporum f. sp. albedinis]